MKFRILFVNLMLLILNASAYTVDEKKHLSDSLQQVIASDNTHDTTIAGALLQLGELYYMTDLDSFKTLCEQSKTISEANLKNKSLNENERLAFKKTLMYALNNIGFYYDQNGATFKAIDYFKESLKIKEEFNDLASIAVSLNNIGASYRKQGQIKEALEFYNKSLKIKEKLGDDKSLTNTLNNIGIIYEMQGENEKAIEYYEKALELSKKMENGERNVAITLNNIALVYFRENKHDKALAYNLESLKIREEINDVKGIANSYHNLALVYKGIGRLEEAIDFYLKSLKMKESINYIDGIPPTLTNMAGIYLEMNNISQAKIYATRSLDLAQEIGYPNHIKTAAFTLKTIHEKQGNYKKALAMNDLYFQMRDSITNQEIRKAALKQNIQYEFEKKAAADSIANTKEIEIKNIELARQSAELKVKKNQQFALFGGMFLVIIFAGLMYNRFKVTKRQKNIIENQKIIVDNKNKEITDSIIYARRIQAAILPPQKIVKQYLNESFILYKPKDIVAGDFYWMESLPLTPSEGGGTPFPSGRAGDGLVLFAAADCTGHGVPGAMVSVVCNNGLNRSVREYGLTDPGKILDKTREIVIQEFEKSDEDVKDGMDIALCSLRFDVQGLKLNDPKTAALLQYAGANNPLWIVRKAPPFLPEGEGKPHTSPPQNIGLAGESSSPSGRLGGAELIEFKANKQPVGNYFRNEPYTTHEVQVQKGDSIYIFTDGFADQFGGEKGKKFMYKPFKELLLSIQGKSMVEQKEILDQHFERWKGDLEQVDDVCVIGVKV